MNSVFIACSLDGFIATKGGDISFLETVPNPDGEDAGYKEFFTRIDALVMGRRTFETVASFPEWPYDKPAFIISRAGSSVEKKYAENLKIGKVELVDGNTSLKSIVKSLNDRGFMRLYIDGGQLIQSFLDDDLVDEMIITRIPVILGEGIPLFSNSGFRKFHHVDTRIFLNELVQSKYVRSR